MRIRVTKRADAHIDKAADWWEQNRPLAPGALDEELKEAFALMVSQPAIGAPALNAKTRGVRRVHLARVHYYLYYRVRGEQIDVLALWHTSRGDLPPV
ncbi:MAG: type II toxin-antitoxin system RelE/ParE family toxin [Pseudomonadota bacterium]